MELVLEKEGIKKGSQIIVVDSKKVLKSKLNGKEYKVAVAKLKKDYLINISVLDEQKYVALLNLKNQEKNRKLGAELVDEIFGRAFLYDFSTNSKGITSFLEGMMLKDYTFSKYKTKTDFKQKRVALISSNLSEVDIQELKSLVSSVFQTRDWVNEPVNKLTTGQFIKEIKSLKSLGISVDVFRKSKLEALNMGGIIGVNQGSHDEAALVKSEWKPKNPKNPRPIVLVGKGVLFDTGGINIKTGSFMNDMKADMGGASTVLGVLRLIATQELPVHLIVLTPITENRINGKELVPGDVIKMHSGKTVEVLNTDAEGRLILADALTFAKKFNPLLVIDAATLTGSAYRITANHGAVIMGTDDKNIKALKKAGEDVYERLIELPMWEEFEETLKSSVADITNLGSSEGQVVCAGFFLKSFTDYPWVHLDIAGSAFRNSESFYLPKGGTGFGVRLLYQYFKNKFVV
tara:strand:- start:4547 stop:5932 length:1386 start_codon:yes stop_codon:yes gene_type:complete